MSAAAQSVVLCDIADERARQDAKWGPVQDIPNIHPGWGPYNYGIPSASQAISTTNARMASHEDTFTDVLLEEVCEAIEEAAKGDIEALRTELIQVAAVAVKWVELLDSKS